MPNTTDLVMTVETLVSKMNLIINFEWPNHDLHIFLGFLVPISKC